jgi:hypothetical protein
LDTGEHPAIAVIVHAMKYAMTRTPEVHRAQRKPFTTPKIRWKRRSNDALVKTALVKYTI